MADRSNIEWTDATWNPVRGCTRVSAGCQHCYAERVAARFCGEGQPYEGLIHPSTKGWNGKVTLVPEVLDQPLRWRRPRRIFVNSMSDLFHEAVPDDFIDQVFAVMALAGDHTFQVLTKRPARMHAYCASPATSKRLLGLVYEGILGIPGARMELSNENDGLDGIQLPNVWLGVSVEDQAAADERIPLLLQCPAAVRWISAEPLLGPVDLADALDEEGHESGGPQGWVTTRAHGIDWVVAGGESGPGARPMSPEWARSLRDQCAAASVPFLFKQWGEWIPMLGQAANVPVREKLTMPDGWVMGRAGRKAAGRLLDGVPHDVYPEVCA